MRMKIYEIAVRAERSSIQRHIPCVHRPASVTGFSLRTPPRVRDWILLVSGFSAPLVVTRPIRIYSRDLLSGPGRDRPLTCQRVLSFRSRATRYELLILLLDQVLHVD
jgi:hypothetical protein